MTTGRINQVTTFWAIGQPHGCGRNHYRTRRIAARTTLWEARGRRAQSEPASDPMDDVRTATAKTPGQTGPSLEGTARVDGIAIGPKADSRLIEQNYGQRPSVHRIPTVRDASRRPTSPYRDRRRSCRAWTLMPQTERTLEH